MVLWITGRNTVLLVLLLAASASMTQAGGPTAVHFNEGTAHCTIQIVAEPEIGEWIISDPLAAGDKIDSTGGYRLELDRGDLSGYARWTIRITRPDGTAFHIADYVYTCTVPLGDVATVFDSQSRGPASIFRQAPQLDAAIEVRPNQGVPFMMGCDHYGNASLAVGAMDQTGTYRITGRRLADNYAITIARREYSGDRWFTGREFTDGLFVSTARQFWYDTVRAFADAVDDIAGFTPRPVPPKADLPYYNTWYALGDKIDTGVIARQAELAAKIGCGNFLIFIGWGVCSEWFSSENVWGDYTPCESRFADFAGLVRRLQQEYGLAVQVWVAPTWIGTGSKSFEKMKDLRSKWPDGGYDRNLDPRNPKVREHIRERFAHLARAYGLDGFYVDFADTIYNRNDADHEMRPRHFGEAYEMFLTEVYSGFTSVREQPLAEFRMPFANLLSKRYATMFNTTYTEGDWNKSRLLAICNRPFARGVLTRCDALTFTPEQLDDRDGVGKAMSATILCGPPGISMDLTKLNADELKRLAAWFKFYTDHRGNLVGGEFRPFGQQYHYPEMLVHRGHTAYAWVSRWETGHIPLPEGTRHAFIFTALPVEVSFIARVHPRHITGLVPGPYRARWFDSSMESHDGWFEITIEPPAPTDPGFVAPLRSARENWDFDPNAEGVPSLDIRRGGLLELMRIEQ